MTTHDSFLREKELAAWWNGIVQDPKFEKVMTYARAAVVESAPERAELIGMEHCIHLMSTIQLNDPTPFEFPPSGLNHHREMPPERPSKPEPKRKK